MSESKPVIHSPLPWKIRGSDPKQVRNYTNIEDSEGNFMCNLFRRWIWKDISRADAEFIVRACNSHYELVEALEEILEWRDLITQNYPDMAGLIRGLDRGMKAMREAKGKAAGE